MSRRTSRVWKFSSEEFGNMVKESRSWHMLVKSCNFGHACNSITVKKRVQEENIDVSHFKGKNWSKGTIQTEEQKNYRYTLDELLVNNKDYKPQNQKLKKRLIIEKKLEDKCSVCNQKPKWNGKKLVLQLDHINGDPYDNRLENLRVICPNCHSQTDTFCGKTKFKKRVHPKIEHKKNLQKVLKELKKTVRGKKSNLPTSNDRTNHCIKCDTPIYRGGKNCVSCSQKNSRKVKERPPKEQLLKEIKELGYSATGRKYGVSDNAIRKWIK